MQSIVTHRFFGTFSLGIDVDELMSVLETISKPNNKALYVDLLSRKFGLCHFPYSIDDPT